MKAKEDEDNPCLTEANSVLAGPHPPPQSQEDEDFDLVADFPLDSTRASSDVSSHDLQRPAPSCKDKGLQDLDAILSAEWKQGSPETELGLDDEETESDVDHTDADADAEDNDTLTNRISVHPTGAILTVTPKQTHISTHP